MKKYRRGKVIAGYRIVTQLSNQPGRMEYQAVPVDREDQIEYHIIVYDMNELPDEYIWLNEAQEEPMMPFERYFLRNRPLEPFPTCIEEGEEDALQWIVVKLRQGYTIDEYIKTYGTLPVDKALKAMLALCSSMETLPTYEPRLGHFNITPQSVRIWPHAEVPLLSIEGFGNVARERTDMDFKRPIGEMSYYLAPELFIGCQSKNADVYGLSLILYMLLTGKEYPWDKSLSPEDEVKAGACDAGQFVVRMGRLWNTSPDLKAVQPRYLKTVLYNGLSTNPNRRIEDITELIEQLEQALAQVEQNCGDASAVHARGFSAVAGLTELKEQMRRKFILPIRQMKLAKAYKITPPNGCLLFGPPGCGKTFVVERIAEEAGIPCMIYKPSDIASIYVHGGQERIKELFEGVRRHAPILVCFDEADAFVSSRTRPGNEHFAGEVNEFLTQLNNAAKDGVYVFLLTNNPELIDPAVLRTGRVDEKFYIPMPDAKGREEFFRIRFTDVPMSGMIDYSALAKQTQGMTFSDLDYVVTESCRSVFINAVELNQDEVLPVTQPIIESVINSFPRSISFEEIRRYERMRDEFISRGSGKERARIGFA